MANTLPFIFLTLVSPRRRPIQIIQITIGMIASIIYVADRGQPVEFKPGFLAS